MRYLLKQYSALSDRDQRALKILALVLIPLVLYFLVLSPSLNYYFSAKKAYAENQELVAWMNENASQVSKLTLKPSINADIPLLQVISNLAEAKSIKLSRLQPEGENRVRIWLNNTEFKQLTGWLSELTMQSNITIGSISVDKTNKSGIVNAQCLLAK